MPFFRMNWVSKGSGKMHAVCSSIHIFDFLSYVQQSKIYWFRRLVMDHKWNLSYQIHYCWYLVMLIVHLNVNCFLIFLSIVQHPKLGIVAKQEEFLDQHSCNLQLIWWCIILYGTDSSNIVHDIRLISHYWGSEVGMYRSHHVTLSKVANKNCLHGCW